MRRFCGSLQFSWGTVNHKGHEEPRRCFCDRLVPSCFWVTFYNYYFQKSFTTEDHRGRFLVLISLCSFVSFVVIPVFTLLCLPPFQSRGACKHSLVACGIRLRRKDRN